ncbi:hypothetical protein [Spongorhabdus nitratireducens]
MIKLFKVLLKVVCLASLLLSSLSFASKRLAVYQGDYTKLGNVSAVARAFAVADVIVLTHVSSINFGNGCFDALYPHMNQLIAKIRQLNPNAMIFGYVSSTADAPEDTFCGQKPASSNWECPEGICQNTIKWINNWAQLTHKPDGIFFDLVARDHISATVRDSIFSYALINNFALLPNTSIKLDSVQFAYESPYLTNQYVFIEGFCYWAGNIAISECEQITEFIAANRDRNIAKVVLVTEDYMQYPEGINCNWPNAVLASRFYWQTVSDRDAYHYDTHDLGTLSGRYHSCPPVWPLP